MNNAAQSTNHILMIEPIAFAFNQETGVDNEFQHKPSVDSTDIAQKARLEMIELRKQFIKAGVQVTSFVGRNDCPDDVFPNNWVSTTPDKGYVIYPMATPSRRRERRSDIVEWLKNSYELVVDLTAAESEGKAFEGTGVLVQDHINRRAYVARSQRSDDSLCALWAKSTGYKEHIFDARDPKTGNPIYHTNVICHIGTGYAAICPEMIVEKDQNRIMRALGEFHELIVLSAEQIRNFSGNALEVTNTQGERYLSLSDRAFEALNSKQIDQYKNFVSGFIKTPIPTIEKHGGGSVRCMMCELF